MKYTISVNQKAIVENDLDMDIKDAVIIDFMRSLVESPSIDKLLVKNEVYFWMKSSVFIKENPLLGINSADGLYRRLLKLSNLSLIKAHSDNKKMNKSYYCLTDKFYEIFVASSIDNHRMKIGRSEVTIGSKSEGPTDENRKVPSDENRKDNINLYSLLDNNNSNNTCFDFFPEKKSEGSKVLNSIVKTAFLDKYKKEFNEDYYFEAKDSGQLRPLAQKIHSKIKEKKAGVTKEDFEEGVRLFFQASYSIRTQFFLKDFNLSNINSKFNDIFARIKEKQNGNQQNQRTRTNGYSGLKFDVGDPRTNP